VAGLFGVEDGVAASAAGAATLDIEQDRAKTRELRGVPRARIAGQMALAERLHGVGRPRMLREMAELAAGPGFIMPSEYFLYRLFDPAMPAVEKRRYIGKRMQGLVHRACTDLRWQVVADDKLVFHALMAQLGFPVPRLVAIYHPTRRCAGAAALRSPKALEEFLCSLTEPVFAKPADGIYSIGCLAIERVEPETGLVHLAFGEAVPLAQVLAYVAGRPGGYLFQERLRPHAELARLSGPTASTIRMLVFLGPDGPELVRALWKIPRGRNVADNFWRGNLLGALDAETGRITRAVSGVGLEQTLHGTHPDTAEPLVGAVIPHWAEARRTCLESAANLPGLRTQSWDVAIAGRGPVLVEVNYGGDLNLPQIAHGSGLLDERYAAHLKRCGFRRPPLPDRLARPLVWQLRSRAGRLLRRPR
jgi:hypothetical protein